MSINPQETWLGVCIENGDVDKVREILGKGVDVNAPLDPETGMRALHMAASKNDAPMIECLLEAGADVDIRYDGEKTDKYTPLMIATENGYIEAMKVLIKHGANVTLRSQKDYSLSMLAARTLQKPQAVWNVLLAPETGMNPCDHPLNKECAKQLMSIAFTSTLARQESHCDSMALATVIRLTGYANWVRGGVDDTLHTLIRGAGHVRLDWEPAHLRRDRITRVIKNVLAAGLSPYAMDSSKIYAFMMADTVPEIKAVFDEHYQKFIESIKCFNPATDKLLDNEGKPTWLVFNCCGDGLLGEVLSPRHWNDPKELRLLKEAIDRGLPEYYRNTFAAELDTSAQRRAEVTKDNSLRRHLREGGRG